MFDDLLNYWNSEQNEDLKGASFLNWLVPLFQMMTRTGMKQRLQRWVYFMVPGEANFNVQTGFEMTDKTHTNNWSIGW